MATTKHPQNDQRYGFLMKFFLYHFYNAKGAFLSFFFLIKALSNDLNTKFTEKNNIRVTDSLNTLISPQVTILSHQSQPTEP